MIRVNVRRGGRLLVVILVIHVDTRKVMARCDYGTRHDDTPMDYVIANGPAVNFNYPSSRPTNHFIDLGDFFVSQKVS